MNDKVKRISSDNVNRLLLVDDDLTFCQVLSRALNRKGYDVLLAHDLSRGLALAEREEPMYAVIDLRIGRESGLILIERLAQLNHKMRMVVLTGYASIATAVEAIKLGATHYLTKPTDADEIVTALHRNESDAAVPVPEATFGKKAGMGASAEGSHGAWWQYLRLRACARDASAHLAAQAQ